MILPQSAGAVLILMLLSLVCWGSWPNTLKLAGRYRYELYYLDFAIGCVVIALILAFTFGNLGFDGFSLFDDLEHSGKRQWLFAFVAGALFNLANMLLTAAISVGGMAVAFSAGIGTALIVGSLLVYFTRPNANLMMVLSGSALIAAAIVVVAIGYHILGTIRHEALARAGKAKSTRRPTTVKAIILAVVGGLLLGSYTPLLQKATETEVGLGPFAVTAVFAIGILFSTFAFEIFFMNLPVQGEPLEFPQYFRARPGQHLLGLLGGMMWCGGMVAGLVAAAAPAPTRPSGIGAAWLELGFPVLGMLWGLFAWREFREGDTRVKLSAAVMFLLFCGGLALLSIAPAYARR